MTTAMVSGSNAGEPAPVTQAERVTALDAVRGFALLGILLMNIVGFGLYHGAYDNPTAAGGSTGLNLWTWYVLQVVGEGKMRCLFSLVFGASVVLLTARLEGRPDAADIYYRRTLWLMVFGIAHSFLLWQGEILYPYALCGLALYPFRRMGPRGLTWIAALLVAYCAVFYGIQGRMTGQMIEAGKAAMAKAAAGEALTEEETSARTEYETLVKERNPGADALARDAEAWRGNPWEVIKVRAEVLMKWVSVPFYHPWNVDMLSMMLLGMALMKWGVLTGHRPAGFYARLAVAGYAVGLPLHAYKGWAVIQSGFDPVVQGYTGVVYDVGRLAVALGHLGMVLLLCRRGWLRGFMARLGAVGQMAFSNYVMHSVVCAFLFTGYGLGLYGRLERFELYYVVAGLWVVQLIASPLWLRRYRFGPLEWAWRSLTYWKRQPMLVVAPPPSGTVPVGV